MSYAPLLIAAGAAVLLLGGKKKKSSSRCPSSVSMSFDSVPSLTFEVEDKEILAIMEVTIPEVAYNEAKAGNRNIIDITKKTIAHMLPGHCVGDKSITLKLKVSDGTILTVSAPEGFYGMGYNIAEDLWQAQVIDKATALQFVEVLNGWWRDHMGTAPIPET